MLRVAILVISSTIESGEEPDKGRDAVERMVSELPGTVVAYAPVPDDRNAIRDRLRTLCGTDNPDVILTMGEELRRDLGYRLPTSGSLKPWARQGVLLLNSILTVREGRPGSHKDKGWETFTDAAIRALAAKDPPVVFMLWGAYAQKKKKLIDPR